MDSFIKDTTEKFQEFLAESKAIAESFKGRVKALEEAKDKLQSEIEECKRTKELNQRLNAEAQNKLDEIKSQLQQLKSEREQLKLDREEFKKSEARLDERRNVFKSELEQFNRDKIELEKKNAWLEIEERRLKFFDMKLTAITEDENIKKKLKELE